MKKENKNNKMSNKINKMDKMNKHQRENQNTTSIDQRTVDEQKNQMKKDGGIKDIQNSIQEFTYKIEH